ncbi:MAG: hypothetical protein ACYDBQ_09740 [Thermoplasmatota archaeon]
MNVQELLIPIVRLRIPAGTSLDLGQGTTLRDFPEDEKRAWQQRHGNSFLMHWSLFMAECTIHAMRTPLNAALMQDTGRTVVESFTTALRLLAGGQPGHRFTYFVVEEAPSPVWTFHPISDIPQFGAAVGVTAGQLRTIVALSMRLRADPFTTNPNLQLALRRFNYAYTREIAGDQILDLAVILETLLSPDGPGEIGYKIATRAARLMGPSATAPPFRALRALYGLRSEIIHRGAHEKLHETKALKKLGTALGIAAPPGGNIVDDCLEQARRLVARVVVAYLDHPEAGNPDRLVAALDETSPV